jgi:hypothetical protein
MTIKVKRDPIQGPTPRYEDALRSGQWRSLKSTVFRRCNDLLPTRRVLDRLENKTPQALGVHMIPIERIVGSAGRSLDFDLAFAPRNRISEERWRSVAQAVEAGIHLPPIRVLKVGQAYLVEDGNHRVSVSATAGRESILADVYELPLDGLIEDASCSRLGYKV